MEETKEESIIISERAPITLELGDIIEIVAPTNEDIHQMVAYIFYIDSHKIHIIDTASPERRFKMNITDNGMFTDESITEISLLNRGAIKGYARQNELLPRAWVDLHFGGDIPITITGEITDLIEDMIEITTYPDLTVIYIDFAFQGMPEEIPIEKIFIREPPASMKNKPSLAITKQGIEEYQEGETEMSSIEFTDSGEAVVRIPESAKPDINIRDTLQDFYIDANAIVFGERLEEITQLVEVPESEQRYGIQIQVNDLMDELLSTIPNSQRTKIVLDNIHLIIQRFQQLRNQFSKFDENMNVVDINTVTAWYKPLVNKIKNFDTKIQWIVPVVTNRKKIYAIYDKDAETISEEKDSSVLRSIETIQNNYRKGDRNLSYADMNRSINDTMDSFEEPINKSTSIVNKEVLTSLDTIVDSLGDFYSYVYAYSRNSDKSEVSKRRFVIQRYGLGQTKMSENLMKSGKKMFFRDAMTPNDTIALKSIIMLPEPVMRYSKLNLPSTSMIEKVNYHHEPFLLSKVLHKKADVISNVIENLEKEYDYGDSVDPNSKSTFLNGIQEFLLSEDLFFDEDRFQKFLETIVPKTRTLLRNVRQYIKDKLSFIDVVQTLEPMGIYPSDITYKQFIDIRRIIIDRISELKKRYAQSSRDFSVLKTTKYNEGPATLSLIRLLTKENQSNELVDLFIEAYNLNKKYIENGISPQGEILIKYLEADNGNYFTSLLRLTMLYLTTPNGILNALHREQNIDEMTDNDKIKPTDCNRRYLAKVYSSEKDLQKDNNNDEVYYDKELDETPYQIIKKYKKEKEEMLTDVFFEFLKENLISKHQCPQEFADEVTKTLILGKKKVMDGEYAMLEVRPQLPKGEDALKLTEEEKSDILIESDARKKIRYYRRVKNNWVNDNTIDEDVFIDTATLFCNISENCYMRNNKICENMDQSKLNMKEQYNKRLKKEFGERIELSEEEMVTKMENDLDYQFKNLRKVMRLREIQLYKHDYLANEIAKQANTSEIIVSPYLKLRDLILGQDDFIKKQGDILDFAEEFCRDALETALEESPHWKYCKQTNIKLLPVFLVQLAQTFLLGGDYALKLNEICHKIGVPSDDGDSIVDKHSGFVIRKIEYSTEEGFDTAGFHISTHSIIEKDLGTVVMEKLTKLDDPIFEGKDTNPMYNVFKTLCEHIDIPKETLQEFVMRTTSEIMLKAISTEEKYIERDAKIRKEKGDKKGLPPYQQYKNEMMIIIVTSVLYIGIQTATPSFKTNKSFPGCIRSFMGYPLSGGAEDMTGITYMACVLDKLKSSSTPWDAIKKLRVLMLVDRIQKIFDGYILKRPDILELYERKREYMLLQPDDTIIPKENSIQKWVHFLPPVVDYSVMTKIQNITSGFEHDFKELIQKGHWDQHKYLNILKSKAMQFGYAIMEATNHIVKRKNTLLKTSSRVPFTENACCNDDILSMNPIRYFESEDENISIYIKSTEKLALLLKDISLISRASILYDPSVTRVEYPSIPLGYLEENIYAAFIKYGQFDRDVPSPNEEIQSITGDRPVDYDKKLTLADKIVILKKAGKQYGLEDIHQLMTHVFKQNIVSTSSPHVFSKVDAMKDIIEELERSDSTIIDAPMRTKLSVLLDNYKPKTMIETSFVNEPLDELKDYLFTTNNYLYNQILDFFKSYRKNVSGKDYNNTIEFLTTIHRWNMSEKADMFTNILYLQNAIQFISKIYPTIILNSNEFCKVPKHWGFHMKDEERIVTFLKKHYEKIQEFKKDKTMARLLIDVSERLVELNMFTQNLPLSSEMELEGSHFYAFFDKSTIFSILLYCFYSAIYEYIVSSDDSRFLTADIEEIKELRREMKGEKNRVSSTFTSEHQELDENLEEAESELVEYQIVEGNKDDLKERICKLLFSFLDIEQKNKTTINLSYDEIMFHVRRSKDKEKKFKIEALGDMSIEERRVENDKKKYKLDNWNVGLQKGFLHYDAVANDREINEMIQLHNDDNADEMVLMMLDTYNVTTTQVDTNEELVEELDYRVDEPITDLRGYADISGLREDYYDTGDIYGDDDPDEFEE